MVPLYFYTGGFYALVPIRRIETGFFKAFAIYWSPYYNSQLFPISSYEKSMKQISSPSFKTPKTPKHTKTEEKYKSEYLESFLPSIQNFFVRVNFITLTQHFKETNTLCQARFQASYLLYKIPETVLVS